MNWNIKSKKVTSVKQSYWKAKKVPIFLQKNDDKRLGNDLEERERQWKEEDKKQKTELKKLNRGY